MLQGRGLIGPSAPPLLPVSAPALSLRPLPQGRRAGTKVVEAGACQLPQTKLLARLRFTKDLDIGAERRTVESGMYQMPGSETARV